MEEERADGIRGEEDRVDKTSTEREIIKAAKVLDPSPRGQDLSVPAAHEISSITPTDTIRSSFPLIESLV